MRCAVAMHGTPEVVAHRGASAYAAEHTFDAYDLALDMGADALELDVRMGTGGELVVMHDRTTERTGREPLALEDVLDRYGRHTRWLIELKEPDRAMADALLTALAGRGLDATIQSFDHLWLRRLAGTVPVAPLLCESTRAHAVPALLRRAARYAVAAGVFHAAVDAAAVQAARARGLRLRAYTVNDPLEMSRLLATGVDGLISDRPDAARAAVDLLAPAAAAA